MLRPAIAGLSSVSAEVSSQLSPGLSLRERSGENICPTDDFWKPPEVRACRSLLILGVTVTRPERSVLNGATLPLIVLSIGFGNIVPVILRCALVSPYVQLIWLVETFLAASSSVA